MPFCQSVRLALVGVKTQKYHSFWTGTDLIVWGSTEVGKKDIQNLRGTVLRIGKCENDVPSPIGQLFYALGT